MSLVLHGFFRSGTSHRLRIALNLKGLAYEQVAVDLRREQHLTPEFAALNPQQLVPALQVEDVVMTQTPALLEWLEERHPTPALLPGTAAERAHVRALAALVGCDIHPLNNRRVLEMLKGPLAATPNQVKAWCAHWITAGFDAFDALAARAGLPGPFACGERPTLADVYLVPQIESARRFEVDLSRWPRLLAIDRACMAMEAFQRAAPSAQPDAG